MNNPIIWGWKTEILLKKENADALNNHIVFCEENELQKNFNRIWSYL